MKGLLVVLIAFVFLPGSIYMLLASNFGALKGYLIAATAFFGFMVMLSAIWTFGPRAPPPSPGRRAWSPPSSPSPSTTRRPPPTTASGTSRAAPATAGRRPPRARPRPAARGGTLQADLQTASQRAVADLIEETNKDIEDSSKELDVTNVEAKTYYTIQDGTEVAAIVISPKNPPEGSGLERPDFAPETSFAYRDPGAPYLPSILFLIGSLVLFVVHMLLLGWVERRRPLGGAQPSATEGERQPAGAGAARG